MGCVTFGLQEFEQIAFEWTMWQDMCVTITQKHVLFSNLQGARRQARITDTTAMLDVTWLQPQEQLLCPAHEPEKDKRKKSTPQEQLCGYLLHS